MDNISINKTSNTQDQISSEDEIKNFALNYGEKILNGSLTINYQTSNLNKTEFLVEVKKKNVFISEIIVPVKYADLLSDKLRLLKK